MQQLFSVLNAWVKNMVVNPYFGLAGFVIGIISLLYAYYAAKRSEKINQLGCSVVSTPIISKSESMFPKLSLAYDGHPLENLTVSKVLIENTGNQVIKPSDIAVLDPIRFSVIDDPFEILDYGITLQSDPKNNFVVKRIDSKTLELSFDYIEPGNNVVIDAIHTGIGKKSFKATGTVIGAKNISKEITDHDSPLLSMFPLEKLVNSRAFSAFLFIIFAIGFAFIGYIAYTLSANFIVGGLCLIPVAFFLIVAFRTITMRQNQERTVFITEKMKSMMQEAMESSFLRKGK